MTDLAAIMRAKAILDDSERERHHAAYRAVIDAARRARETGQEQPAGFDCMGCAVVVRPPEGRTPTREEIDARVAAWRDGRLNQRLPLQRVLGMTDAEYAAWLLDPTAIPERPLPQVPPE